MLVIGILISELNLPSIIAIAAATKDLALVFNLISITLLYYLWTKYDVSPIDGNNWELFFQGLFIINSLYFLINFFLEQNAGVNEEKL